jgi:hypothetical protein
LMISEFLGVVWPVNPRLTRDCSSFMISESLGVVRAVNSTRHP